MSPASTASPPSPVLTVAAPLRVEALALASRLPRGVVVRTGYGPGRSLRSVSRGRTGGSPVLVVAGLAAGLAPGLATGDVVVADQVRHVPDDESAGPDIRCPGAPLLADLLREQGLTVRVGPVATAAGLVRGPRYRRLAATGAVAVDMESAVLVAGARAVTPERLVAVVRVVVDTADRQLLSVRTPVRALLALATLARSGPALAAWALAQSEAPAPPRQLVPASVPSPSLREVPV